MGISYNSPLEKQVVKKKTMESGRHAWASVFSMRARKVSIFVSPHQSLVISCPDNDLRNPHHRWAGGFGFSTFQIICKLPG